MHCTEPSPPTVQARLPIETVTPPSAVVEVQICRPVGIVKQSRLARFRWSASGKAAAMLTTDAMERMMYFMFAN